MSDHNYPCAGNQTVPWLWTRRVTFENTSFRGRICLHRLSIFSLKSFRLPPTAMLFCMASIQISSDYTKRGLLRPFQVTQFFQSGKERNRVVLRPSFMGLTYVIVLSY